MGTLIVEGACETRALQQIKDRGYADKYRGAADPIHIDRQIDVTTACLVMHPRAKQPDPR
ncbi:hypothetical protein [Rhodoferax ferrireducens]|uniref:hypothetical protein n=1 Tax=Rhodoferax ferrireducens TaxID=192843 RepID=UPI003BB4EDC8